ncbi:hypothetical protein TWF694_005382 [Orbilia ellipsospora]|uniref:Uncharacterized protein n=1 Tax=Orbilia ellipsospora TaxID=2528407 RepID=A0AAV9WU08_9PEZI
MVNIISTVVAVLSAVVAVQSAAVPDTVNLEDIEQRSPNPNPLVTKRSGAIIGRRHYIYDGVKLVRTADPKADPDAAELHKRYASRLTFAACKPFGMYICGTCYSYDVSYDVATCIPTPLPDPAQFLVFQTMTNAWAVAYGSADCTGTGANIAGCTTHSCNTGVTPIFNGFNSVLAKVGCS